MQPYYLEKLPIAGVSSFEELSQYCKKIEDLKYNLNRRSSTNRSVLEPTLNRGLRSGRVNAFVQECVEESQELEVHESTAKVATVKTAGISRNKCWNCLEPGHNFQNCVRERTKLFCFRCGLSGFITQKCPKCSRSASENEK